MTKTQEGAAIQRSRTICYEHLRGRHNLVFARSRGDVELYADLLRRQSEAMGVPNEFYPHHANLSRAEREALETRLRDPALRQLRPYARPLSSLGST